MAAYKGSVELISGITQKNGGDFPLMDASAIQYDDTGMRMDEKMRTVSEKVETLETEKGVSITEEEIAGLF